MNANGNDVSAKTTTSTTKFDNLTLVENGLVLKHGKKQLSEISFSGMDKIYVKVYKLKPIYGSIFVSFPMLLIFLFFESIQLNIELYLALIPVIPAFVKTNRFKSYGLVIVAKDGSVYKKQVSRKLKSDTVELINVVKRKMLT